MNDSKNDSVPTPLQQMLFTGLTAFAEAIACELQEVYKQMETDRDAASDSNWAPCDDESEPVKTAIAEPVPGPEVQSLQWAKKCGASKCLDNFRKHCTAALQRNNESQNAFAQRISTSQKTVWKTLGGDYECSPRLDTLLTIAQGLDLNLFEIMQSSYNKA